MNRIGGLSRERPVLLIDDQAWDAQGGGAVILKSLLGDALGHGLLWATPGRSERDLERGQIGLGTGSAAAMAQDLESLARRVNAAAFWVVLHGKTVAIADRLARTTTLPIHATVHDDPAFATALRSRRRFLLAPRIAGQLRRVLQRAKSIDVVCDAMAERYRRKYGVESMRLHRGLDAPVSRSPDYDLQTQGLRLGILGNTYSYRQLPILGEAVRQAAATLDVRGRILVCGAGHGERLARALGRGVEVEVRHHVPEAEGIELLKTCFALYLNYPFGRLNRVLRETSFPTKLSTYVYAARPVIVHAPPGTSVAELPREYARPWPSLSAGDGETVLTALAREPRALASHHELAEDVRRRYYDGDANRAALDRILRDLTR